MADFETQLGRYSAAQVRLYRIYWNQRLWGLISFTVPLVTALIFTGIAIRLQITSGLLAFLIGAIIGRIGTLIADRFLHRRAAEIERLVAQAAVQDREDEYQRKLRNAKANGDFDRWSRQERTD